MIRVKIKEINIHNVLSFQDEEWDFENTAPLVLIKGENKDTESPLGNTSNGSGKSSFSHALMYVLFGQLTGKFHNANLKNNLDNMYINSVGVDGAGYYYLAYGMPSDQYETYLREMTEFSVRYEYIRSAIVEAERFEVTQEEMDTLAGNLMTQYGYTDLNSLYEKIKSQHGIEGPDFLREQVKLNKASDLIFSTAVPES